MAEKKGTRPKVKSASFPLRISEQERVLWTAAAEKRGQTLSEFLRYAATKCAEEAIKP